MSLSKSNGLRMPFYVDFNVYVAASVLSATLFFSDESRDFLLVALYSFSKRIKRIFSPSLRAVDLSSPAF